MDPIEQWLRADSSAGKAAAGNRLVDEVRMLRAALAELIEDVFGPEREPGESIPEDNKLWDLDTSSWLEREARYRAALTTGFSADQ